MGAVPAETLEHSMPTEMVATCGSMLREIAMNSLIVKLDEFPHQQVGYDAPCLVGVLSLRKDASRSPLITLQLLGMAPGHGFCPVDPATLLGARPSTNSR